MWEEIVGHQENKEFLEGLLRAAERRVGKA